MDKSNSYPDKSLLCSDPLKWERANILKKTHQHPFVGTYSIWEHSLHIKYFKV